MSSIFDLILAIADAAEAIAHLALIVISAKWLWSLRWVDFAINDGEVTHVLSLRAKDINPQSLTNAVSSAFYNGGLLPPDVRRQIIEITNPDAYVG